MTREELTRKYSWILAVIRDRCELTEAEKYYLNVLIEVLEQEPCEDCISRAEALRQTKEWRNDEFLRVTNPYYYLEKRLNDLPSVTPAPKMGHWIDREIYDADRWKCSECWHTEQWRENYCPNCGANMSEIPTSSEKPNKWVPCSERLPNFPPGKDEVLITIEDEEGYRGVYKGFYEDGLWWTQMYCGCNKISIANPQSSVVAWMPLPEPFKESEDNNGN